MSILKVESSASEINSCEARVGELSNNVTGRDGGVPLKREWSSRSFDESSQGLRSHKPALGLLLLASSDDKAQTRRQTVLG